MSEELNREILALQERMRAGELTAEEYMIAVTRLTDPARATEMEGELLIATLPDTAFEDDDVTDEDDDDDSPLPPVPDGLTSVYGTREVADKATKKANMASVLVLVSVLAVIAVTSFVIALAWVLIRSSMG